MFFYAKFTFNNQNNVKVMKSSKGIIKAREWVSDYACLEAVFED